MKGVSNEGGSYLLAGGVELAADLEVSGALDSSKLSNRKAGDWDGGILRFPLTSPGMWVPEKLVRRLSGLVSISA